MKKVCLTAVMLVLMITGAYAQAQIGLKAGINISTLGGEDAKEFDDALKSKLGYHIGAVASFGLTESVFLQPELLFSLQGTGFDAEEDVTWNISYINIPVMAKVFLTEGLNLQFGPQFGINLSNKIKIEDETLDWNDVPGIKTNKLDIAAGLGLGYDMPMGLNFNVRYNYGLTNIFQEVEGEQFKLNNQTFQLSIGYFFNRR
jgi:opacity protein-like surface antigen